MTVRVFLASRQTAMVSAFEEVYEKKKAVFDTWQIKDFSEVRRLSLMLIRRLGRRPLD